MARAVVFVLLVLSLAGCSGRGAGGESRHTLNDRERDSLIARSRLPGATVPCGPLALIAPHRRFISASVSNSSVIRPSTLYLPALCL